MRHVESLRAFVKLGWRRSAADKATAIGLTLMYWLILAIFWGLWQATSLQELMQVDMRQGDLLHYLIVTEIIAFAVGYPYRFVESDIVSGDIAAGLMRPVPYALAVLAEWTGQAGHRVLVLSITSCIVSIGLTGELPIAAAKIPLLLLSIAVGGFSALLCQLLIGYAAAWTGSAAPIFWIWQKALFVLGGLIMPLSLYPSTLQTIAKISPFASMLYAPGSMTFETSAIQVLQLLTLQLAWLVALSGCAWLLNRAVTSRFALHGM